jgi:hypothetical protein
MKSSNFAIASTILGLLLSPIVFKANSLSAQDPQSLSGNNIKISQVSVSNFADGVYQVGDPKDPDVNFRRFIFRKNGNQVTGVYIKGPSSMCIEGTLKGNLIIGKGYKSFDGLFPSPQEAIPRFTPFKGSNLQSWDVSALKVAEQVILYLPMKSAGTTRYYQLWSKYRRVRLDLDGFQKQKNSRTSLPRKCELRELSTGRNINESEWLVLVP